jgi:hypothetical protein
MLAGARVSRSPPIATSRVHVVVPEPFLAIGDSPPTTDAPDTVRSRETATTQKKTVHRKKTFRFPPQLA